MSALALNAPYIAFGLLAAVAVASALLTVTLRNIVHAAYFLVLCLLSVGGLYIILGSDLVGLAQVLVYGGAVSVVLVFAIMLTRVDDAATIVKTKQQPFAAFLGLAFAIILISMLRGTEWSPAKSAGQLDLTGFADAAFGKYVVPFEAISILLLAAMAGAIYLSRKGKGES